MKHSFFTLCLFFLLINLYGQNTMDSLVQIGNKYHDDGQYDKAIEVYKKALEIDPNSPLTNYEMAMTYMYAGDYQSSIDHANQVINFNKDYLLKAYVTKGSCLDYQGKTQESIQLLEKGVKKFGDNYLLCYNLALDYYKINELEKSKSTLIKALNNNFNHASSHLLLGYVMNDLHNKVESLLCLYYFLLLEPGTERSKSAYKQLKEEFSGNVKHDENQPNQINIMMNVDSKDSEFRAAELMISLLEASKSLDENKEKSSEELFIENTTSFFKILGELKKKKNKGLWWDAYIPFFYNLSKSDNMDTFCYYISGASNDKSVQWLQNNQNRLNQFDKWLNEK